MTKMCTCRIISVLVKLSCDKLNLSSLTVTIFKKLSKPNATQLNSTLKQLALELDTVVTCTPPHPTTPPQTFQPLLDQLES